MKQKEKDIQNAIVEWLEWKKIFHYRNNTGAFVRPGTSSFYRFGVPGAPDIVCVISGLFVGIEVKRPGGRLSPLQEDFGKRLTKAGGIYIVATSIEDVEQGIAKII